MGFESRKSYVLDKNILMMLTLGILLYLLRKPFRRIGGLLLAGFLFSLSIECIQLVTWQGKFETDAIMNNVSGELLGSVLCRGMDWVFSFVGKALYAHGRKQETSL